MQDDMKQYRVTFSELLYGTKFEVLVTASDPTEAQMAGLVRIVNVGGYAGEWSHVDTVEVGA